MHDLSFASFIKKAIHQNCTKTFSVIRIHFHMKTFCLLVVFIFRFVDATLSICLCCRSSAACRSTQLSGVGDATRRSRQTTTTNTQQAINIKASIDKYKFPETQRQSNSSMSNRFFFIVYSQLNIVLIYSSIQLIIHLIVFNLYHTRENFCVEIIVICIIEASENASDIETTVNATSSEIESEKLTREKGNWRGNWKGIMKGKDWLMNETVLRWNFKEVWTKLS